MKRATWADINGKIGISGSPLTKCPTKGEVLRYGMRVSVKGEYSSNQLVSLDDVIVLIENIIYLEKWSSNKIRWKSTYPLGCDIVAIIEYRDINGSHHSYSFSMEGGQSIATVELPSPIEKYIGLILSTR